jgi:hypothetical protein
VRTATALSSLLAFLLIAAAGCGGDGASPGHSPDTMRLVAHTNYGCTASRGGSMDCLGSAALHNVEALSDTVVLWIAFEANCCPEFTASAVYDAGVLDIAVVDTLYGCRCICPYENAFRFFRDGAGEVRVRFESRATVGDACISGLDTTITLP